MTKAEAGRLGGLKGGHKGGLARARTLSKRRRREIARKGWNASHGITPAQAIERQKEREEQAARLRITRACWHAMMQRCCNPKNPSFSYYGGRQPNPVTVPDEWLSKKYGGGRKNGFKNFVRDLGLKPIGYSLDRIVSRLGYSADNCQYITPEENSRKAANERWERARMQQTLSLQAKIVKYTKAITSVLPDDRAWTLNRTKEIVSA